MTWNYRVVRKNGYLGIHEAFYTKDKENPVSITVETVAPAGEKPKELKKELKRMLKAFKRPIIEYDSIKEN